MRQHARKSKAPQTEEGSQPYGDTVGVCIVWRLVALNSIVICKKIDNMMQTFVVSPDIRQYSSWSKSGSVPYDTHA